MASIELRLQAVTEYVNLCDKTFNSALEFLTRFKELYDEITIKYKPGDPIYHEAKALLYTVLCWITTDYNLTAETELFFGSAICHRKKAGECA